MNTLRTVQFTQAVRKLADAGFAPARIWQQRVLGNHAGAMVLLNALPPDVAPDERSAYIDYVLALEQSTADPAEADRRLREIVAHDSAHLMGRMLLEQLATERGDQWERHAQRTAREEIDPSHSARHSTAGRSSEEMAPHAADLTVPELTSEECRLLGQTPVITETVADLFREQGHHRMAAAIYKHLLVEESSVRLSEKLRSVTQQNRTAIRTDDQ